MVTACAGWLGEEGYDISQHLQSALLPALPSHGQVKAPGHGTVTLTCGGCADAALGAPEQLGSQSLASGRMASSAAEHPGAKSESGPQQRALKGNQLPLGTCMLTRHLCPPSCRRHPAVTHGSPLTHGIHLK